MKYFLIFCSAIAIALSISTSCNKPAIYDFSQDSIRGLWGRVELFNEFGERAGSFGNIQIVAHISDTINNFNDGSTSVFDTIITTYTNEKGEWVLRRNPPGYYTIEMLKEGYGKNQIYQHRYDTTHADTLPMQYLAQKAHGSIRLDSIVIKNQILNISRTIYFVGTRNYALSTWYFFDTTDMVSNESYAYAYVAGAKNSDGQPENSMTIQKPLEKLYASGMREGQQVYMRAYCDNYKYMSYQVDSAEWEYPNLLEGSNVMDFVLPVLEIE
ncbi:MAG: hypothetical protein LBR55_01370 [Bacteroidales bacterium]|jgi:hypothetical protein|nr:hypothetical protein [Bacteroidales bacterium]